MSDNTDLRARRDFMLQALVVLPASQLLGACALGTGEASDEPSEIEAQEAELGRGPRDCDERAQRRRARWRRLLDEHMGQENKHDLPGVMATFSEQGEMIFNRQAFRTPAEIAQGHILFGFSAMAGSLANT